MNRLTELTWTEQSEKRGNNVLIWAALDGAACITIGCLMVYIFSFVMERERLPVKFGVLAVGIILIVIGLRLELMTVKDVREGPKSMTFYVSDITSRSGIHGITGLRYYLKGTDSEGESKVFPLPYFEHNHISEGTALKIEYYENINRIIRLD
ncbi:MAG: hypothetical protein IKG44_08330 [Mogibacterium sp.]|nr:hypothetical protein [Mogibacterium sp.]